MAGQLDALHRETGGREPGAERAQTHRRRRPVRAGALVGDRHADGARDVLRPGPAVTLLAPAVDLREQLRAAPHPQRPDALGTLELVGGDRDEVRAELLHVEIERRRGLDRVDVEQDAAPGTKPVRDLPDGLDRPDLVVGQHHRDERGSLVQGRLQLVRIHPAAAVHRDLHHLEAELLQVTHGVSDGVVLHGARHETVAVRLAGPRRALDGQVVRLRAAGRDHHLASRPTERDREALVGLVERVARNPSEGVGRGGIPERAAQVREHGFQGLGAQRRGRRVVQVDRHQGRIVRRDAREAR